MTTGLLKVLFALLQIAPLAQATIANIMKLIAGDPGVPPDLKAILQKTGDNYAAALTEGQVWLDAHPE